MKELKFMVINMVLTQHIINLQIKPFYAQIYLKCF